MSVTAELQTKFEAQYKVYRDLFNTNVTSLDTYKQWLSDWRAFIYVATQIQCLCKKVTRAPHVITTVKTTWGSYNYSEASSYQSMLVQNATYIKHGIKLRCELKKQIKSLTSEI